MNKKACVFLAALASALSMVGTASATTPYNYFSGGVYEGASKADTYGSNLHWRDYTNVIFPDGTQPVSFWLVMNYATQQCTNQSNHSSTSPLLRLANCPGANSSSFCGRDYQTPSVGFLSGVYCRTTHT